MPLYYVRNDITKMDVDIIVNSTSSEPTYGQGVDFAIFSEGGKELIEARKGLGFIQVSEAKYTKGYNLPSKYVIHTVGPFWHGQYNETEQELYECYNNVLKLCVTLQCKSIAIPLISSGVNGLPKEIAFDVSRRVINDFISSYLKDNDIDIYLVLYDKHSYNIVNKKHAVDVFVSTSYIMEQHKRKQYHQDINMILSSSLWFRRKTTRMYSAMHHLELPIDMEEEFEPLGKDFKTTLFEYIDDSGKSDPYIYKKANITRATFNKIKNKEGYKPSKKIVVALCCALELKQNETHSLLRKAGIALTETDKFDLIVDYFIEKGIYDVHYINEFLYHHDQELLGSK